MTLTKEIVQKSLELREKVKIPLRQVLQKITLNGVSLEEEYLELIKNTLNLKEVIIEDEDMDELTIDLDTEITRELKLEGIARNLVRNINNYRKKMRLSTSNRIKLYLTAEDDEILEAISKYQDYIKKQVQADVILNKLDKEIDIRTFKVNLSEVSTYLEVIT